MTQENSRGLQLKSDWETRFQYAGIVGTPFTVEVEPTWGLLRQLSPEEEDRLQAKLGLVKQMAERLAMGMLKGTLKYTTDYHSAAEYQAELGDELADVLNYWMLKDQFVV